MPCPRRSPHSVAERYLAAKPAPSRLSAGICAHPYRRAPRSDPADSLQPSPLAGPVRAEPAGLALRRRWAMPKGWRLPGREAERFGMGPAIVLGQGVAGLPRPVSDGAVADLAACNRKMRHGYREAARTCSAHRLNHASPSDLTVPEHAQHARYAAMSAFSLVTIRQRVI